MRLKQRKKFVLGWTGVVHQEEKAVRAELVTSSYDDVIAVSELTLGR